jgi:AcrR family transcriptional regulator
MFLDQGYESFSVDALIQQVGGSKRNVYGHFKGKEGLFITVITELCSKINAPLGRLEMSGVEPEAALKKFSAEILREILDPRTLSLHRLMISEARRFPRLALAIWNAGHQKGCKILAAWISEQQRKKALGARRSAEYLSNQFISMLTGYVQLKALLNPSSSHLTKKETDTFINNTVESFLFGNAPRKGVLTSHSLRWRGAKVKFESQV